MTDPVVPVDTRLTPEGCEVCKGTPPLVHLVNYDIMWGDGEVICAEPGCGRFVRHWDAG